MNKRICIIITLLITCTFLISLISCNNQSNIELGLVGGDEVIISKGDKQVSITSSDEIQKIVNLFPTELKQIGEYEASGDEYKITFVYEEFDPLEIYVIDQKHLAYEGFKCKTIDSTIDIEYIQKLIS